MADRLRGRAVDLMRFGAGLREEVVAMLRRLERALVAQIAELGDADTWQARALARLLEQTRQTVATAYGRVSGLMDERMLGLGSVEAEWIADRVNESLGLELTTAVLREATLRQIVGDVLIQGAPSREWWARQADDLMRRFSDQMRLSMLEGETLYQAVRRVREIMPATLAQAEAQVRTAVQAVSSRVRLEQYRDSSDAIKGVTAVATMDSRTTPICIARDGLSWTLEGEPMGGHDVPFLGGPPWHWQCRTILAPYFRSWAEMGVDLGPDAREGFDGQPVQRESFDSWLGRQSEVTQNRMLGRGRAQLWRDGSITLTDLLSQSGRPLTLRELRAA